MLQCNHCFPPPLIFLSYYTLTVFPTLSALHQTHACSNSNASTTKPIAFALPHTLDPTSRTISPKIPGTLLLFLPSTANSRLKIFQLSNIVLHPYQSVQCVCACMHACVRACMHACVHLAHSYASTLVDVYIKQHSSTKKEKLFCFTSLFFPCFSPLTCCLSVVL